MPERHREGEASAVGAFDTQRDGGVTRLARWQLRGRRRGRRWHEIDSTKLDEGWLRPTLGAVLTSLEAGTQPAGVEAELAGDDLSGIGRNQRLGQRPELLGQSARAGTLCAPLLKGRARIREIRDGFGGHRMTSCREMRPS
jgi:hypothetical protein